MKMRKKKMMEDWKIKEETRETLGKTATAMAEAKDICTIEKLEAVLATTKAPKMYLQSSSTALLKQLRAGGLSRDEILEKYGHKINTFSDGKSADQVYAGIYVGDGKTAKNFNYLKENNFKWVLNTAQGTGSDQVNTTTDDYKDHEINFLGLKMEDTTREENLLQYLEQAIPFIDKALEENGNILIHCYFGMSRSASIAAAYLIARKNFTAEEALRTIAQNRQISPNATFLQQLCDLDNQLRGLSSVSNETHTM